MPVPGALLVPAFLAAAFAPQAPPREMRVAAAADLKFTLEEVAAAFRKAQPGVGVSITYGSSGNFFAQIENGAPFDLFLSADLDDPGKLEADGLVSGNVFVYAKGRLALCVPASSPLPVGTEGLKILLAPGLRKIAIANPRHAPYGRAAEEAMKNAGLLDAVRQRLVLGENVSQAAQFVQSGVADAGVVALSLARSPAMARACRCVALPAEAHAPLVQGGAILKGTHDPEGAKAFRDILLGPVGQAILRRHGFEPAVP
ncbi:MAG: molybdate ABC transporter substrate-binding protein [Acidithiobacillales bacterium]